MKVVQYATYSINELNKLNLFSWN